MRTVSPRETVNKSINRLIDKENLTVTDDADGSLVIREPTWSGYLAATLKTGENILSGSARFDRSKSFRQIVVLGQHAGTDTDFGIVTAEDKGMAANKTVSRVIKNRGQSSNEFCGQRAEFEQRYREAQSTAVSYSVHSWRTPGGEECRLFGERD